MSSASEASAIPVGGDPSGSTPSPEYRGNTAEDIAGQTPAAALTGAAAKVLDAALAGAYLETEGSESMPTDKTTAASKSKGDPFAALAKEYAKLYPKNKTFHITSDKQVFLEKNKSMADLHQRNQKGGKVTSITID